MSIYAFIIILFPDRYYIIILNKSYVELTKVPISGTTEGYVEWNGSYLQHL